MAKDLYQGSKKTIFEATIKRRNGTVVDISSASVTQFNFRKPNGATATVTANFLTDGTDGMLTYTDTTGDLLALAGILQVEAYLVLPSWSGPTSRESFEVKKPIITP